jgi:hypothetical protein
VRFFKRSKEPELTTCPRCTQIVTEPGAVMCPACGWDLADAYQGPSRAPAGAAHGADADRGTA